MSEFLDQAFTLPTAIFSVLLIPVALYWLVTLFGFLDLGILDGLFDLFEGAADGAVDGALEGAAEGLGEGAAELGEGEGRGGCLGIFGGVPITITGTLFVVLGWIFTFGGMDLVTGSAAAAAVSTGAVVAVGVGSTVLSLALTALAVRPLRKLFHAPPVTTRNDLVGRICTITTLRVDDSFGQAEVDDGGSAILIQARSRRDNELTRGSQALVYEYDPEGEVFYVAPLEEGLERAVAEEHGAPRS